MEVKNALFYMGILSIIIVVTLGPSDSPAGYAVESVDLTFSCACADPDTEGACELMKMDNIMLCQPSSPGSCPGGCIASTK